MPIPIEEKRSLFQSLQARVREEYQTLLAAQRATQEGATHEEARPENDKDTRALEQTYLARGQAERVATLKTDVGALESLAIRTFDDSSQVALTALVVVLDDSEKEMRFLLAPAGAGEVLESSIGDVKVVTQKSPLGRALLGARVDDDVELRSPTGLRVLSVVHIA